MRSEAGVPPTGARPASGGGPPAALSSFVGRERELEQLRGALRETRLLTLTGAGGAGKTRLALRLADDARDRFPGEAWWVDLAPLADPHVVGEALATALGVRPLPGMTPLQASCAQLAGARALVVLDNCEHLLAACADVAEAVLRACPEVTVVVTSRTVLGVAGETQWRVPGLSLPEAVASNEPLELLGRSDAVRLFEERARKAHPGFTVSTADADAVARICRELDGLPLAIELAAARVRMMSAQQIAAGLADRFHLLTGGSRSALPRHRTLRASVDWSHGLLSTPERALLRRLAVFSGGFTLALAEAACADPPLERAAVLDTLGSLVDQSLVVMEERDGAVRYRLLETVRRYALDRLGEAGEGDRAADRHRDAMLATAERIAPELLGPDQAARLAALDAEAANLIVALDRAAATDPSHALRLCVALTFWWKQRGLLAAGERGFALALDAGSPEPSALRAHALFGRGYLAGYAGRIDAAVEDLHRACAVAEAVRDGSALARSLMMLGFLQLFPDPLGGRAASLRARDIARACGDDWAAAAADLNVAFAHLNRSELDAGERLLDDVRPAIERLGSLELQAWNWLGRCYRPWGAADRDRLREYTERGLAFARAAGEPTTEALAHGFLAHHEILSGTPAIALERMRATWTRVVAAGAGLALGYTAQWLARAQAAVGDVAEARATLEPVVATGIDGGFVLGSATVALADILRLAADAAGAERRAGAALAIGERIGAPPIVASAKEVLARVAARRAEWARAESLAHEALGTDIEHGLLLFVPQAIDVLAEVAAGAESDRVAARTLGIADRVRSDLGLQRPAPDAPRIAEVEAAARRALGDDAYALDHRLGWELPLDEAVAWLRRARGERGRPARGWESLTPTELRVARLVADGLTNPQIAERMFVTRETVKSHLSHVFAKLGIATRAELAAEVTRREPVAGP